MLLVRDGKAKLNKCPMRNNIAFLLTVCMLALSVSMAGCAPDLSQLIKRAESGDSESQYKLGFIYDAGLGVNHDHKKAMYWMNKSASQGNSDAKEYLESQLPKKPASPFIYIEKADRACQATTGGTCILPK